MYSIIVVAAKSGWQARVRENADVHDRSWGWVSGMGEKNLNMKPYLPLAADPFGLGVSKRNAQR
jgi:hypothetical protein